MVFKVKVAKVIVFKVRVAKVHLDVFLMNALVALFLRTEFKFNLKMKILELETLTPGELS